MKRLFFIIFILSMGCAAMQHQVAGDKYLKENNYEMAVKEYQQALQLKPELTQKPDFQERFKKTQIEYFYEKGVKFEKQLLWDEAVKEFKNILEIDQGHFLAKQELSHAQIESSKTHYKKSLIYASGKKFDMAIAELNQSVALNPDNLVAKQALEKTITLKETSEKEAAKHNSRGEAFIKNKNLDQATKEFGLALQWFPESVRAQQGLAEGCYQRGLEFEKQNNLGNALIEFKKALKMADGYEQCRGKIAVIEKEVKKRISYRVALSPFKNPSKEMGLANALTDELLKNLLGAEIANVEIIEKASSQTKRIDAIIAGTVLALGISTNKRIEARSDKYQSGARREYNPDYDNARFKYEEALRDYEQAAREDEEYRQQLERERRENERRERQAAERARRSNNIYDNLETIYAKQRSAAAGLTGAMGEFSQSMNTLAKKQALNAASREFQNTPMYNEIPIYDHWNYNIHHYEKKASLEMDLRVSDIVTGNVLCYKRFIKNVTDKDDYIDNPNPSANVNNDPLELASDEELKNRITSEAAEGVTGDICSALADYGIRYSILAGGSARKGDVIRAIEEYVNFIYSSPKHAAYELVKAKEYIKAYRNYSFEE